MHLLTIPEFGSMLRFLWQKHKFVTSKTVVL